MHWQSMLAPANTPKEVLETLFKAIVEALQAPQVQEAFNKQTGQRQAERVARRGAGVARRRARDLAKDITSPR